MGSLLFMRKRVFWVSMSLVVAWASCSDDEDRYQETSTGAGLSSQVGESCVVAGDCFAEIARDDIIGEIQCLDRVDDGYCTHLCTDDLDCCAVEGECDAGETQVCGPFESTGMMMCFLSCEKDDISGDADDYCAGYHPDFHCRSTGGGSDNRKVCVPSGNGPCAGVDDCGNGFDFCCENALGDLRCYDASGSDGRTCLD